MEWYLTISLFFGALIVLLALRVPVAVALLAVNMGGAILLFGFLPGLRQVVLATVSSLSNFSLVPIPLFILMGELLFKGGIASRALEALDRLLGRLPARMAMLTVVSGTLFAAVSGSTMANTALMGKSLLPDMIRRKYPIRLAMGSIIASSGLAMIVPPSALVVIWGSIAGVPVGQLLIAGLLPGLLMAINYMMVIVVWAKLESSLIEVDPGAPLGWIAKSRLFATEIAPIGGIVIAVVGSILFGIATPSESAAIGVVGSLSLLFAYRRVSWSVLVEALIDSARVTATMFFILAGASVYSQILSFSGATSGASAWLSSLPLPPIAVLITMMLGVVVLGLFLEQLSIMLVTLPFFLPIVHGFGWDPVWFGIIMLMSLQIALTTPPFGLSLFIMKGVAPRGTRMKDIYLGALPFVVADITSILIVIAVPQIALLVPSLFGMGRG